MVFQVQFTATDQSLKVTFAATDQSITPGFDAWQKDTPKYNGKYEVVPLVDSETVLMTAQKILNDNIVVKQIPYFETSNDSDGQTVYIGKVE